MAKAEVSKKNKRVVTEVEVVDGINLKLTKKEAAELTTLLGQCASLFSVFSALNETCEQGNINRGEVRWSMGLLPRLEKEYTDE